MSAIRPLPPIDARGSRLVREVGWTETNHRGPRLSIQTPVELVGSLPWWTRQTGSKLNGTGLEMQPQSG